jgi:hypothetical protein
MNLTLVSFIVTCFLAVLLFVSFYFKFRHGSGFFYLVSMCSIFFGGVCYFFYGFPLDEGIVPEKDIPVFERNFYAAAILLIACAFTLVVILSRRR